MGQEGAVTAQPCPVLLTDTCLLRRDPVAEFLATQRLKLEAVFDILHKLNLNSSNTSSPPEPLLV